MFLGGWDWRLSSNSGQKTISFFFQFIALSLEVDYFAQCLSLYLCDDLHGVITVNGGGFCLGDLEFLGRVGLLVGGCLMLRVVSLQIFQHLCFHLDHLSHLLVG